MSDPVILDCGHLEHPVDSMCCQTVDCPNREPVRMPFYEWTSVVSVGLMVWYVHFATGRRLVEIILSNLPDLFQ